VTLKVQVFVNQLKTDWINYW